MNIFQTPLFMWSLVGVIGVSVLIIVFNELLDRLRRQNHQATDVVQFIRDTVLPGMALLFMLRFIIVVEEANIGVRLVSTLAWGVATLGIIRLSRVFLNGESEAQARVPSLMLRLPTFAAVTAVLVHVIQNVWGQPIAELATTLGLGSVVIAFALQDTLSNLVSGLLLVANSPFTVNEWISVNGIKGRVVEVNWRYTSLEDRLGDLIVIPNGAISAESIVNHSRPSPYTCVVRQIDVAYVTPPNKVKRMFIDTLLGTQGVLHTPAPTVAVTKIDDPLMGYEIRYWIADVADQLVIDNQFMTRVWYAAQRHKVPFPSPAYDLFHYDAPTVNKESELTSTAVAAMLRELSTFEMLPDSAIEQLAAEANLLCFAESEHIVRINEQEQGVHVMLSGKVNLCVENVDGIECLYKHLQRGDFFGESGIFGRSASQINITVVQDTELILLDYQTMNQIINRFPNFSAEVSAVVTERQHAIRRLKGEPEPEANHTHAGTLNGVSA